MSTKTIRFSEWVGSTELYAIVKYGDGRWLVSSTDNLPGDCHEFTPDEARAVARVFAFAADECDRLNQIAPSRVRTFRKKGAVIYPGDRWEVEGCRVTYLPDGKREDATHSASPAAHFTDTDMYVEVVC